MDNKLEYLLIVTNPSCDIDFSQNLLSDIWPLPNNP